MATILVNSPSYGMRILKQINNPSKVSYGCVLIFHIQICDGVKSKNHISGYNFSNLSQKSKEIKHANLFVLNRQFKDTIYQIDIIYGLSYNDYITKAEDFKTIAQWRKERGSIEPEREKQAKAQCD